MVKLRIRAALGLLALLASGCADRGRAVELRDEDPFRPPVTASSRVIEGRGVEDPVILITIDGVRWQEIFNGTERVRSLSPAVSAATLLPNLHKLGTERGAFLGAPGRGTIAASGPNFVSLPGYTEILGGRPSPCRDNGCSRTTAATLLDEAEAAGAKVAGFGSWERLEYAASARTTPFMMSFGRHGDDQINPWPGHGDYRPDHLTADAALAYYAAEQPDVLFLGLGDPDEYAHRGDYNQYIVSLRYADQVVGRFLDLLDASGDRGRRTHVVVTADHGRSYGFSHHGSMYEAARVWMVAAGPWFTARGPVASTRARHLADIAPTLRLVLGLAADSSENAGSVLDELF